MISKVAALLLLASSCFAQKPTPNATPRPYYSTASIWGTVRDAVTHLPLEGVTISRGLGSQAVAATTDRNGSFNLIRLEPGDIAVELYKQKYALLNAFASAETTFHLSAGDRITRNFELTPGAEISGRLVDRETGALVTNLRVTVLRDDFSTGVKRHIPFGRGGSISQDGRFSIEGLLPGEYLLEATPVVHQERPGEEPPTPPEHAELAYVHTFYPGVPRFEMAAGLTLSAGETRTVEFPLTRRELRSIYGSLSLPKDVPGPIHYILDREAPGYFEHIAQGSFASPGAFHIGKLTQGEYTLLFYTGTGGLPQAFLEYAVAIGDRDLFNLQLSLHPGIPLDGFIQPEKDEPVFAASNLRVSLTPLKRIRFTGESPVAPTASGSFSFAAALPGRYFCNVTQLPPGWIVSRILYQGADVGNTSFELGNAALGQPIAIYLTAKAARLTGTVNDSSGHPKPATLALLPESVPDTLNPLALQIQQTDTTGTFAFPALLAGKYKLVALFDAERKTPRDLSLLRAKSIASTSLELAPGQSLHIALTEK